MNVLPVKIVLVNTSHPGNIGAAARAMKTMGLSELVLVAPHFFPDARATEMASNADDVLQRAVVVSSVQEAIADCELILGTSARRRTLPWPLLSAREAAIEAAQYQTKGKIAILFGREEAGLSNEELQLCHYHVYIPGNPNYNVLNLAQAVQIIAYELLLAAQTETASMVEFYEEPLASPGEVAGFYVHLESTLIKLGLYNPLAPKKLLPRVKRLFSRVKLERHEINILRGILTAVEAHLPKEAEENK